MFTFFLFSSNAFSQLLVSPTFPTNGGSTTSLSSDFPPTGQASCRQDLSRYNFPNTLSYCDGFSTSEKRMQCAYQKSSYVTYYAPECRHHITELVFEYAFYFHNSVGYSANVINYLKYKIEPCMKQPYHAGGSSCFQQVQTQYASYSSTYYVLMKEVNKDMFWYSYFSRLFDY